MTACTDTVEKCKGKEASSGMFLIQNVMNVHVLVCKSLGVNHECDTVNSCVKSRPDHKLSHFWKYVRTISTVVFACVGGGKVGRCILPYVADWIFNPSCS